MTKQKISFKPQILDLSLYSGDGNVFHMTVRDLAGATLTLTGTMRAQIRDTRESPDPPKAVFQIDMAEADDGFIVISLPADQSELLISDTEVYRGVWDLEWTPAGEEPLTICQGNVECLRDVTR